jgi:excisionase family DNA binding protein
VDDNIPPGYITVSEAARRLRRSTEQVRRYLREGKLPGRRIGGQWFIEGASFGVPPRLSGAREFREVATMEYTATSKEKADIESLIARVAENREAIRKRLGGRGFTRDEIVRMIREDRDSH